MERAQPGFSDLPALAFVAAAGLAFAAFADYIVGLPCGSKWYAAFAGLFSAVMIPLVIWRYHTAKLLVYIAFLFALLALCVAPWNPRKRFLADLYSIRPGMTVSQVEARMKRYMLWDGRWRSAAAVSAGATQHGSAAAPNELTYRHSDDPMYNADLGIIKLRDGKVVSVEFSGD